MMEGMKNIEQEILNDEVLTKALPSARTDSRNYRSIAAMQLGTKTFSNPFMITVL